MVRTVISLDERDKKWLDRKAKAERVTMTEMVRRAVRRLREEEERQTKPSFAELLDRTAGTWDHGDALDYQQRLREEWTRPRE
jgi:hypothetical protein